MSPIVASKKENEEQIKREVFSEDFSNKKPKFKINDMVRIYKYKNLFEKSYTRKKILKQIGLQYRVVGLRYNKGNNIVD